MESTRNNESFPWTLRAECLDAHWFSDLVDTTQRIEAWRTEHNANRPHRALGERTPNEFANQIAALAPGGRQASRRIVLGDQLALGAEHGIMAQLKEYDIPRFAVRRWRNGFLVARSA